MKLLLIALSILLGLLFCNRVKADGPYFSNEIFGLGQGRQDLHDFIARWYSEQLKAMNEPSLYAIRGEGGKEAYRFLWLRTFHKPISVRLNVENNGTGVLTIKVTDGAGGYEPGKLVENRKIDLKKSEVAKLLKKIEDCKFWELPTQDISTRGLDGAQWVIEGVRDGRYHIVDRWSPEGGRFRKAALFLIKKARLKVDPVY